MTGSDIAAAATQTGSLHLPVSQISAVETFTMTHAMCTFSQYIDPVNLAYTDTVQEELQFHHLRQLSACIWSVITECSRRDDKQSLYTAKRRGFMSGC